MRRVRPASVRRYAPGVGQTQTQRAAKTARAAQPTKRTGKQQREASRTTAGKKRAAGRSAAATTKQSGKAPLPRGTIRAQFGGTCPACLREYGRGEPIRRVGQGWGHPKCVPSGAELEFARNKACIEAGETFRSRKPSDWKMGASPSNTKPAR